MFRILGFLLTELREHKSHTCHRDTFYLLKARAAEVVAQQQLTG